MTEKIAELYPSVNEALSRYGIMHEIMPCDPLLADTAAFCEHYGFSADITCNAIIAASKTDPVKYACGLIPANSKLDVNKKVCQLLSVKRCSFASADQTLELTGMLVGGVTPVGLPDMPIYIDAQVMNNERVVIGGGNRSTKLIVQPQELLKLPRVQVVDQLAIQR